MSKDLINEKLINENEKKKQKKNGKQENGAKTILKELEWMCKLCYDIVLLVCMNFCRDYGREPANPFDIVIEYFSEF